MKDFLKTGEFGPIRLGDSLDQILKLLGRSEFQFFAKKGQSLKMDYGSVELYFGRDDKKTEEFRLSLIALSTFKTVDGGNSIHLDPWMLRGQIPIEEGKAALDAADIRYSCWLALEAAPDASITGMLTEGQVKLLFINENVEPSGNWVGLCKISFGQ